MKKSLLIIVFLLSWLALDGNMAIAQVEVGLSPSEDQFIVVQKTLTFTATIGGVWDGGLEFPYIWSYDPAQCPAGQHDSADSTSSTVTLTFGPETNGQIVPVSVTVESVANGVICSSATATVNVYVVMADIEDGDDGGEDGANTNMVHTNAASAIPPLRVPPSKTKDLPITITPKIEGTGHTLSVSVDNSGDTSGGTASVSIPSSGTVVHDGAVTVLGGTQTYPGHANKLKAIALLDGAKDQVAGTSKPFSVAAWPTDVSIRYSDVANSSSKKGIFTLTSWLSDSGSTNDLDAVSILELVGAPLSDSPPFSGGGSDVQTNPIMGNAGPGQDEHTLDPSSLTLTKGGTSTVAQAFTFTDARTGYTGTIPNSGFNIQRAVSGSSGNWTLTTSVYPATVGNDQPGSGSAFSPALVVP